MSDPGFTTLPRDLLEAQLSMVDLIRAMYPPSEGDADLAEDEAIDRAREWCESPDLPAGATRLPSTIGLAVTVPIQVNVEGPPPTPAPSIQMSVTVPLSGPTEGDMTEPPPITYSLRQPAWLSRAEVAELGSDMPVGDILAAFDYIQDNAPRYYTSRHEEAVNSLERTSLQQQRGQGGGGGGDDGPLLRVWFYFPSLSTREKRKDLVNYAPGYGLTGFVLAGKPGVLCLEGTSRAVDEYMNAIKNESWGDIPSHQKKVSERFREECGQAGRKFDNMSEITDDLGERRGARKNRGDMAALEAWLKEKGVGESFSRVIMGG